MTIRPRSMRFMGGAAVFPGGAVAPADLHPLWEESSALTAAEAARRIGIEDPRSALGAFVCALRETYEEVGLLLGSGASDGISRPDADDSAAFLTACRRAGVILATDALTPVGRWVTPLGSPVRFDARFFLVEAPTGWEPDPDPREVEACFWTSPAAALDQMRMGELAMAPPTIEMLQQLLGAGSVREALESGVRVGAEESILSVPVADEVTLVLAPNPGLMTGPGTNSYTVGREPAVVVDPAVDDGRYLEALLEAAGGRVSEIVVTHRHPDHVGGAVELQALTGARVRAFGPPDAGGAPVEAVSEGESIATGRVSLTVIHAPGHAADHICLVHGDSLMAGDNILGEGTAVIAPPDGHMRSYLATLERLRSLQPRRILPGHYRPLDDGVAVIDHLIAHRRRRHAAILAAIEQPSTVDEIVDRVYTDIPAALHPIAKHSVRAHLVMAREDGMAELDGYRWKYVPDESP
jgi:glyoxylase-like metal-dependent hydrolase (beta-lactamase superfamily II)/8-oxo-dGTP pyrophosphatase MutT (NUDIX family)